MVNKTQNKNLHKARNAKKDEFYTQMTDIENELRHYKEHFKDKVIYCNCDDPRVSNFFHYFFLKFEDLDLKKLIATCYKNQNPDLFSRNDSEEAIYLEYKRDERDKLISYSEYMKILSQEPLYKGDRNNPNMPKPEDIGIGHLRGNGDFRSEECIAFLKQADIVVTNPPFSLFREYVAQLIEYGKKFIIIGNVNAITYKEIFKLIRENKLWLGLSIKSGDREFGVPDNYPLQAAGYRIDDEGKKYIRVKGVRWFTNLDYRERHEDIILWRQYTPEEYPKYDNYDAIEVSKTKDIPMDYAGVMGVPITFLDKYNPEQFEVVGKTNSKDHAGKYLTDDSSPTAKLKGKNLYHRILIKNKRVSK